MCKVLEAAPQTPFRCFLPPSAAKNSEKEDSREPAAPATPAGGDFAHALMSRAAGGVLCEWGR